VSLLEVAAGGMLSAEASLDVPHNSWGWWVQATRPLAEEVWLVLTARPRGIIDAEDLSTLPGRETSFCSCFSAVATMGDHEFEPMQNDLILRAAWGKYRSAQT
jgi:hypothetical protein